MSNVHATITFTTDPYRFVTEVTATDEEVRTYSADTIGIDLVREVSEEAHRTPTQAPRKCLVLGGGAITVEAQNALLKVLEEPPATSRFLIALPHGTSILTTVASRVHITEATEEVATSELDAWQALSYKDRLAAVDTAIKGKDVAWQQAIKQGLLQQLQQPATNSAQTLQSLHFVAQHLLTRGASNKYLLEELALLLPLTEAARK